MMKQITCDCGVKLQGKTEDEVVAIAQEHGRTEHQVDVPAEAMKARVVDAE